MKKTTNNNLSDSWTISPLSKVIVALESGSRPKGGVKHITDGIPSLGAEHLDKNGTFNLTNIRYVPEDFAIRMTRGNIRKGDILVVKDGATTGKTSLVRESFPYKRAVINEHVFLCRCNEDVMPDYIFYYLFSSNGNQQILKDFRGAAQGGISQRFADLVMVPLAPYGVQKLIVSEIEKQFSRLDEAVAALKRVRAGLKRYKVSVLKAAVEGKLTEEWRKENPNVEPADKLLERIKKERSLRGAELRSKLKGKEDIASLLARKDNLPELPKGWVWATTDQLFSFVTSGSRGWASYYSDSGPLFLRMGNLDHDTIKLDLSDIQHVQPPEGTEGTRTRVMPGDILISITADVGMVGIVPDNFEEAYINQHIALARPTPFLNNKYLAWFLACKNGQNQFKELQRGATKAGLGLDDIRAVNVPLPSYKEQEKIIEEIESRFSVVEEIEETIDINLKRAERLRQAILKKAFLGRLV